MQSCLSAFAVILLLSCPGSLAAQESKGFDLPDSHRVSRDPFFFHSLFDTPFQPFGAQLSPGDRAVIDNPELLPAYTASWKSSFLMGVEVYQPLMQQPQLRSVRKETFFQKIQVVIGVAELAGVAYLGYKAIKKEPITRKK